MYRSRAIFNNKDIINRVLVCSECHFGFWIYMTQASSFPFTCTFALIPSTFAFFSRLLVRLSSFFVRLFPLELGLGFRIGHERLPTEVGFVTPGEDEEKHEDPEPSQSPDQHNFILAWNKTGKTITFHGTLIFVSCVVRLIHELICRRTLISSLQGPCY